MPPGALPAVLRFTAPLTASYTAVVHARGTGPCFGGAGVSLWAGSQPIASHSLTQPGSIWDSTHVIGLTIGQTVDLVVDNGGNSINCDHVDVSLVITSAGCGPADVGGTGGTQGPDGALNNNDFVVFVDLFFTQSPAADQGSTGGAPGPDNQWDNNDFVVFIDHFFTGCS